MDQFYLDNTKLFQQLVEAVDVSTPAPHFSRHKAAPAEKKIHSIQYRPNIVTAARIRPMLFDDDASGFPRAIHPELTLLDEPDTLYLHDLYNHPRGRPLLKFSIHEIDYLFDENATDEDLYTSLVADLVVSAQQGSIGTLFAYGQTGSGKTFTISHLQRLAAMSLTCEDSLRKQNVFVTIVDLAGNSTFDLLNRRSPITVLQGSDGATHLTGAREFQISSAENMLSLFGEAASYRRTAPTMRNDASSRSHSICRIRIQSREIQAQRDGLLFLVDLAGSEGARDTTQHKVDRLRETREINTSLSVLKECIRGKSQSDLTGPLEPKPKLHIPIRQSTLTRVLKHVFDLPAGGHAGLLSLRVSIRVLQMWHRAKTHCDMQRCYEHRF